MSNRHANQNKRQTVADAIASVRAEGLNPSQSTTKRLQQYADGKITASQLRRETLKEVRLRSK